MPRERTILARMGWPAASIVFLPRGATLIDAARWAHARRPYLLIADLDEAAQRKTRGKKPAVISPLAPGGSAHRRVVRCRTRD